MLYQREHKRLWDEQSEQELITDKFVGTLRNLGSSFSYKLWFTNCEDSAKVQLKFELKIACQASEGSKSLRIFSNLQD